MNRLNNLFLTKNKKVLSVYFSAGHPNLKDTATIICSLAKAGADIVEIGMPFSDPVADGPVIQQSSLRALKNGMSVKVLFEQLEDIRQQTQIPIVLMGYLNPVLQYGIDKFCERCKHVGVDGLILPDLPPEIFNQQYRTTFDKYNLCNILLVPPQTSSERILQLDKWSSGFLYIVAASSTTGAKQSFQPYQVEYFKRLENLKLSNPKLIGFGISSRESFDDACNYANGAIIGSAFVKALEANGEITNIVENFIREIKG
ncbi:MAG: tryptophan synthase subunit alpha [Bacteroidales bacterium]|nr:tryptophan synthase subunit alpha [Bacteroidales bacterium]